MDLLFYYFSSLIQAMHIYWIFLSHGDSFEVFCLLSLTYSIDIVIHPVDIFLWLLVFNIKKKDLSILEFSETHKSSVFCLIVSLYSYITHNDKDEISYHKWDNVVTIMQKSFNILTCFQLPFYFYSPLPIHHFSDWS